MNERYPAGRRDEFATPFDHAAEVHDRVRPQPGDLPDQRAEIDETGLFTTVEVKHFDWEITYTAEQYVGLLQSFSSHIALAEQDRGWLFGELRRRIDALADSVVHRHWGAALHIARAL